MTASLPRHRAQFDDVDTFLSAVGWDGDFRQLTAGALRAEATLVATPHAIINSFRLSRSVHQRGKSPSNFVTLGIPNEDGVRTAAGKAFEPGGMLVFHQPDGFDCVSTDALSGVTLSFSVDSLARSAELMELELPDEFVSGKSPLYSADPSSVSALRERARRAASAGSADEIEVGLSTTLLALATGQTVSRPSTSGPERRRALNRAIEIIDSRPTEMIRVQALCEAVGTSWRTLDRAFREHFGTTPKTYQKSVQLNRLRRALRDAPREATVSAIASRWGFTHSGQLAKDYRALFHESPSETLER